MSSTTPKITKSDAEWRAALSPEAYRVARKHAAQLRRIALSCGFFVPLVLASMTSAFTGRLAAYVALIAALSAGLGVFIERWLFFAEAKHTVTLYYGQDRV